MPTIQSASLAVCRTRSTNEISLGSRFDWFVVEHGNLADAPEQQLLPRIIARCSDIYQADVLRAHQKSLRARTKIASDRNDMRYVTYSYSELQRMLARYGNRVRCLNDVWY